MNTATRLMRLADDKAKVSGTYFGIPFTGTAISSRQLNWGPEYPEQLMVTLDQPITVFGGQTKSILINSRQIDEGDHTVA